jgi:hypothetical protein
MAAVTVHFLSFHVNLVAEPHRLLYLCIKQRRNHGPSKDTAKQESDEERENASTPSGRFLFLHNLAPSLLKLMK